MGQEIQIYQSLIQISVVLIAASVTTYSIAISILGTEDFRRSVQAQIEETKTAAEQRLRKGTSFEEAQAVVSQTSSKLQELKKSLESFSRLSLDNVVYLPSIFFILSILSAALGIYYYPALLFQFPLGTKELDLPYVNVSASLLAIGIFLLASALSGIQRAAGQPRPSALVHEIPPAAYDEDQLRYRQQLKEEVIRLGAELTNTEHPNEVPYPVWLCNHNPELRRKLVGNNTEHDIIQKFYSILQKRYDHQKTITKPDSEFMRLNYACVDAWQDVFLRVNF